MSNLTEETAEKLAAAVLALAEAMNRSGKEPNPFDAPDPRQTEKDFERFLGFVNNS